MADVVTVQLRFAVDTPLGVFQDTLTFSEDEWAKRDQKAIDAAKQARADTWIVFQSGQLALQTAEGKQARIAEIVDKIDELTAAKAELEKP